jgi:D-arabinose 5-phosphate isomerase GutQ
VVLPAFNQVGQGSVTVTLTNDNNFTASVDVPVTVVNPAVPPTIQPIANLTTAQNTPAIGSITLGDANPATVTLVASSSNPALIPTNNIIFSGSGANRVVTVFPAANQVGSAFITVVATNQDGLSANASFIVTVSQPAVPPTIQPILELTTQRNTPVSAQFLVGDANLATLSVTATSSNSALIPAGNVLIQGQGTQRTVTVFPLTGQTGTALITLTARNQSGLASAFTFTVRVIAPPAIGAIPTIFIAQNSTATRSLFVSDDNLATLAFAATSSNPTLIPPANVVVSGFGDSRILTITPARNQVGNTVQRAAKHRRVPCDRGGSAALECDS